MINLFRYFLYCYFILTSLSLSAQNAFLEQQEKAAKTALQASKKLDQGFYKEAVALYTQALTANTANPNPEYMYGKALANYRLDNFKETIKDIDFLLNRGHSEVNYYRLLGNSYDLSGQHEKAISSLRKGLRFHPYAGSLFLDMGIIELLRGHTQSAIDKWEEGVNTQPTYADNYYWLAKIYAKTNELVWSAIYAELFLNMERSGDRMNEISQLLHNVWLTMLTDNTADAQWATKAMLTIPKDELTKEVAKIQLKRKTDSDFYNTHQEVLKVLKEEPLNKVIVDSSNVEQLSTLATIVQARLKFWDNWHNTVQDKHPNLLYERHRRFADADLLSAYYAWLLSGAKPHEFNNWTSKNADNFNRFMQVFISKPLGITFGDYMVRTQFVNEQD